MSFASLSGSRDRRQGSKVIILLLLFFRGGGGEFIVVSSSESQRPKLFSELEINSKSRLVLVKEVLH